MENQNEEVKEKRKIKPVFLAISAAIVLIMGLACYFELFLKLDYRLYDGLLKLKKEIPQNERVALITIDDEALADPEMGEWPWPRNIIADALIRMKELGVEWAVFDIEYLSPSTAGVNSKIRTEITNTVNSVSNDLSKNFTSITNAISEGYLPADYVPEVSDQYVNDVLYPSMDYLEQHITDNIYQDNDIYFQKALQFFGNAWLTFNQNDLAFTYDPFYIDFVKCFQLKFNVSDIGDYIVRDNAYTLARSYDNMGKGFTPALEKIGYGAYGIGFTNSIVDEDGVRRRYELLFEDNGDYGGQLVFAPLMNLMGVTKLTRTRNALICHDALMPGETTRRNIKIPLDNHGRVLVNFIHSRMRESFKQISVLNLKRMDWAEEKMYSMLDGLQQLGINSLETYQPIDMCAGAEYLKAYYDELSSMKESMLERCTGFTKDGGTAITDDEYAEYYAYRQDYFDQVRAYLEAHYEKEAYAVLDYLLDIQAFGEEDYEYFTESVKEQMDGLRTEYEFYATMVRDIGEKLKGTYCIVGNIASSTSDIGAQPFEKQYQNVGLHANLMNTILNEDFYTYVDWYWGFLAAALLGFIPYIFHTKSKSLRNILGAILFVGFSFAIITLFVVTNIYIPMVGSIIFMALYYLFGVVYRFVKSDREKKFITNAFSQCLAPDVVKELIDNPSSFRLGGDSIEMTAIFTDIQKFSAFSELLNAAQLVALLNYYLTKMSDIIIDEKGTVDKYEGDAIIALVGAPKILPDHSFRACSAAIKMKQAEAVMNADILEIVKKEKPEDMEQDLYDALQIMVKNGKSIFTRIGINSGEMVAGYMGSEKKKNYTMMGNNVNLASRLEGVNKVYASSILCSGQTYEWAVQGDNKDKILFRRLDRVRVVNITTPVQLYNVIGFMDEVSPEQKMEIDIFHSALDKYLAKDFINAGKLFLEANKTFADQTALIFAERCKENIEKGVPDTWDGIVNLTSK